MRHRIRPLRSRSLRRLSRRALLIAPLALACSATPALAVSNLEGWMQDDPNVMANPVAALTQFRGLGVTRVRLTVRWSSIAPSPNAARKPGFNDANPAAYPAAGWRQLDAAVREASSLGIQLNLDLAGPEPVWAAGPGHPHSGRGSVEWSPIDADYEAFYKAVATRYSGSFKPAGASTLPRVSFWTIWNEANYGAGLDPQGLPSNPKIYDAPTIYRHLVADGWTALHQTGHGSDTIVIGEITPRGNPNPEKPHSTWGLFSGGILPIPFVQAMYCLGPNYRPLRGTVARLTDCADAGTAHFKARNPGLFAASGFSIHPYSRNNPPNIETPNDPYYASFADLSNLTRVLDRSTAAYHSGKKFMIWNTEYGYQTSPPKPAHDPKGNANFASIALCAQYMNQAEYLSYTNPRIANYMQYLLVDPARSQGLSNDFGGYTSGLEFFGGAPKLTYYAWRMPLYLPSTHPGGSVEVWGDARPAQYAMKDVPSTAEAVSIQYAPAGSTAFKPLALVPINNSYGYYDTHVAIPGKGTVRAVWQYPTGDLKLQPGAYAPGGYAVSRPVTIS